jgi:RNA polymerase sigma-70 factor (ECF subfamily)
VNTDEQIVEAVKGGGTWWQSQMVSRYCQQVFAMIARQVGDAMDAEELTQDTFLRAFSHIDSYDPQRASLATWLSRIAYHESLNFLRVRRPDIVFMDDRDMHSDLTLDPPEEGPHDSQTIQLLEQALTMLPPNEQAVITMFYYDNMSLADIAYVTGSIPSTVGSQLCRIRKKLYKMMKTLHV